MRNAKPIRGVNSVGLCAVGLSALVAGGCGQDSDPFADDDGLDPGADARPGPRADAGPTGGGADAGLLACAPPPARLVVLGDSINACTGVGGKDAAACGPRIFHDALAAGYAPGVTYENLAVPGAVAADVSESQLGTVPQGPGHVLLLVYIGGNDLQPYIFVSDAEALQRFETDMPMIAARFGEYYDYFADTSRFPDGFTLIMNTQYNPFDDCTAPPYNLSATKIDLLGQYNGELTRIAGLHGNVVITEQHAPYLGHGHHYNVTSCPYYMAGATNWMGDLIHPNVAGHANLAKEWNATADRLYRDCLP
jgi:lysophospholipase L1-like esterase